ncbi:MAG: class II fructose-bisphosphatase [Dehalococcoidales bacterium]|nr:MAG: class II fructose-bisphosphatase [Dehalococcoidales bacterium]
MSKSLNGGNLERNIALELVRTTEAAAIASARYLGLGDKEKVDQSAVDAMRMVLGNISMAGIVVIGEGEKDEAPMLYIGEKIGNGSTPIVDIAVDPVDGTNLVSKGLPGAISAIVIAPRDTINFPSQFVYMDKIVTGEDAKDCVNIEEPVATNLMNIAKAKQRNISEITVVVLDRPRHEKLISEISESGARIKLITDGDISAAIHAAMPDTGVDVLMGIGGTPEGVISAAAVKCIGGVIQGKIWPRNDTELEMAKEAGVHEKVYTTDDLVNSDDVFLSVTGISSGELLTGVRYSGNTAQTQSLVMRSLSGTLRWIDATHNLSRLDKI